MGFASFAAPRLLNQLNKIIYFTVKLYCNLKVSAYLIEQSNYLIHSLEKEIQYGQLYSQLVDWQQLLL